MSFLWSRTEITENVRRQCTYGVRIRTSTQTLWTHRAPFQSKE
jgi:hypothetical protein